MDSKEADLQMTTTTDLYKKLVSFDLEITKDSKHLKHMGAILLDAGGKERVVEVKGNFEKALFELNSLAKHADFVLGHNIIQHDLPWLKSQTNKADTALFDLPIIDTLFLSPLAFPKNPYHRLVKDYKLVKDSYNNPVADARLALSIFKDQLAAFKKQYETFPELIELYRHLFSRAEQTKGIEKVFEFIITKRSEQSFDTLVKLVAQDKVCANQLKNMIEDYGLNRIDAVSLAYVLAWVQVCEGNSVLPPWVWRTYPRVKILVRQLRQTHCGNGNCSYCLENFDAKHLLNRFFEMRDFRKLPDGTPLQEQIVKAGIEGESSLGILPTGGGKSLCFQLPALVRNMRDASLTIVISPLQALMKDQVDNLKSKTGADNVAAIYGMLTMLERMAVLDQVRMGDIAILYLSPEQLRNKNVKKAIQSRQIGAWVFDEAHCLSKWGHDFRPDYLNCAKVIANFAKEQEEPPPPVFCYTATAKLDVIDDIVGHFKQWLGLELKTFEGGVERDNLIYEVVKTESHTKESQIFNLLEDYFDEGKPGSCVIYCASRKRVEDLASTLKQGQQLPVAYFHAGLEPSMKHEVLESFIEGTYRIIVATNAFGMGIDKDDVRLVIHCDIPGSLENYLQEAGRAGRDLKSANCILLFDSSDIEQQFKLAKHSEIRFRDITELLKEIRYRGKFTEGKVVATSKELLRSDYVNSISVDDQMADTKVKTAISWLEREGFLSRDDNVNSVFQGKPLFATLEEAKHRIGELQLSTSAQKRWELILEALLNADVDEGINADDILDTIISRVKTDQEKKELTPESVMLTLAQMADCGLVSKGFSMTAYLKPKGKDSCKGIFNKISEIEKHLLDYLPTIAPDVETTEGQQVDLRVINTFIKEDLQTTCSTRLLLQLFRTWSEDGKTSGKEGSINFHTFSRDLLSVRVNRSWKDIKRISEQRQAFTQKVIDFLYGALNEFNSNQQKKVLVSFELEEIIDLLKKDIEISSQLSGKREAEAQEFLLKGIQRALLFLDTCKSIELQSGMAVFKQAMEIHVTNEKKGQYQKANYQQLDDHYHQKIVQVHVMYEYAQLALKHVKQSTQFIRDYFSNANEEFLGKYFHRKKIFLERATSQESWNKIVTDLNNLHQQEIVHAKLNENQLVLAGPGSGKTKVIIHRIAYLMRVEHVRSNQILALTFNHNAAVGLHKRLVQLIGKDAAYVRVHTFHGLALRLLGQSFDFKDIANVSFDNLIVDAIKLLKGEEIEVGLDEYYQRSTLLDGVEHILVDEYQDIDEKQYEFIAALAGKTLEDEEKLSLMAVGDDDQSIYSFREANVKFIQQFQEDYQANIKYLTQNYRSTKYIIEAANSLIKHNNDRMKTGHPIEINQSRRMDVPGGRMPAIDPENAGKIKVIQCKSVEQQVAEVLVQLLLIKNNDKNVRFEDIAIVARNGIEKPELGLLRSLLHENNIPYQYARCSEDSFSIHSVREIKEFQSRIREKGRSMVSVDDLYGWLPVHKNYWHIQIEKLISDWELQFGIQEMAISHFDRLFSEYLFEQRRQTRFGNGVLLSTVHGVKGEEYKYVLVLGGNWAQNFKAMHQVEDETRLYYVAMTRAIDQLILFSYGDQPNPHISRINGDYINQYYSSSILHESKHLQFATTGLNRLYISYPSNFSSNHEVNVTLDKVNTGDQVRLKLAGDHVFLEFKGVNIARIAKSFIPQFQEISSMNYEAKVVAMVKRDHDPKNEYEKNAKIESWWLPVVEVVYW